MLKKKVKPIVSRTAEDLADALDLPKSISIEWKVRYEVINEIIKMFAKSEMTVVEFAKKAETSRSRITRILKSNTTDISLDVLFRVLGATGQKIEIKFLKAS